MNVVGHDLDFLDDGPGFFCQLANDFFESFIHRAGVTTKWWCFQPRVVAGQDRAAVLSIPNSVVPAAVNNVAVPASFIHFNTHSHSIRNSLA